MQYTLPFIINPPTPPSWYADVWYNQLITKRPFNINWSYLSLESQLVNVQKSRDKHYLFKQIYVYFLCPTLCSQAHYSGSLLKVTFISLTLNVVFGILVIFYIFNFIICSSILLKQNSFITKNKVFSNELTSNVIYKYTELQKNTTIALFLP